MQRDKRGRFIKKAETGTKLDLETPLLVNKGLYSYRVKPDAATAFAEYKKANPTYASSISDWLTSDAGKDYIEPLYSDGVERVGFDVEIPELPFFNIQTPIIPQTQRTFGSTPRQMQMKALQQNYLPEGTMGSPKKISYTIKNGKKIDQWGQEIPEGEFVMNHQYFEYSPEIFKSDIRDPSVGRNLVDPEEEDKKPPTLNKEHLANMLELVKAGIGVGINNKIAERAKKAEIPFLQNTSEFQRSVVGNYEAKLQGEKAAAQLRNLASRPLTSDGNAQQNIMLEAQLKGQQYIDQGNSQDNAAIRQSRETSWQQNKENTIQRQAAATANQQAMLMTNKNKSNIDNMRDSNNFSQIINPYLSAMEQRLRNKEAKQDYYEDHYNNSIISAQVWGDKTIKLSPTQEYLRSLALMGGTALNDYIKDNETLQREWAQLSYIMKNEILRRQAALRDVVLDIPSYDASGSLPYDASSTSISYDKKGGTIYKAKLRKRTKDNDRAAKSIESSKKIAARFLEKAMDSLYTYDQVELIAKPKNKRKYQAGGGLPFVGFTPVFATSEAGAPEAAKTAPETSKTEDLTSKDVLELLKDMDGLPSDMALIVNALQNFEMQKSTDPLGLSSAGIASQYINLISKIKVAKFNREEYNTALNTLKGNGGLNEYAITSDGLLIGTNADGDFKFFSAEDIKQGKHSEGGYSILTNSNLLYLRANSTDAAFNHKLTTVAQNGIGIATVNKLIQDVISHLGTSTESSEGYVKTKQGDLIQGLQDFYEAAQTSSGTFNGTIHDLYKGKLLTKSQAEQAKKAIQYIYLTLPENAKTLLKVKSDGSEEGAVQLIETLISAQLKPEQTFDLDLVGGKTNKSSGSGSGGKDDTDLKTSLPLNVQKGIGGVDSYLQVDRGDGIHLQVRGTQYNLITTPNGDAIQDTSLANMLAASGLQGLVKDLRNIQFGDQKISPEVLASITYNNTGITRANLPIKPDGSVDLDLLEKYEHAEQEIDALSDRSLESVKQIYEKYGLTSLLNADGSYNLSKFGAFMVTEGYTTDALSGLKESEFVKEFQGDTDAAAALIQRCLQVGTGKNAQTPDIDTFAWYNPGDWFGWTDVIYKGVVYIPITNNVNTAVFGANQSLDYDEALIQEEKYQNFEKMSRQKSTDSELLNI